MHGQLVKLHNPSVNREMNLLNLINPSLAHVCTVAPHCQIMDYLGLKNLSRKIVAIYAISYFLVYI